MNFSLEPITNSRNKDKSKTNQKNPMTEATLP